MKKKDLIFVALVVVVLAVFFAISGKEKTSLVPYDETHQKFFEIAKNDGKKAAEKFCGECHTEFPDEHPPPFRCLFCHKTKQP